MPDYSIYIDDSGHPDDQPYVVAAGFIAPEKNWLAFEPEWKDALAKHGIGDVFHMTSSCVKRDAYQNEVAFFWIYSSLFKNTLFAVSQVL